MKKLAHSESAEDEAMFLLPRNEAPITLPHGFATETSNLLKRMFRDPRVLEPHERGDLIAQLRRAVDLAPLVPEIRVLLGMALCVDLQVQEAMEEMRQAVKTDPNCFIARLKFGELLMRLRVCDQAAEHTQCAAQLASNAVQSELARRQASTIRTMLREGIERGGNRGLLPRFVRLIRKSKNHVSVPVLVGSK
jgi:uncharacterized protein HemY